MRWVILYNDIEETIYGRIDDDGLMRVTCIAEHQEFQEWLSLGNTPEEWKDEQ